jgi:cell division protein FtsB
MANKATDYYGYQYGTEARKQVIEKPYPIPNGEPLRRPKPQAKPKADILFGSLLAFCGIFVFSTAISFVHMSSVLSSKQHELQRITRDLRTAQSDMSHLETIIASRLNLDYVQEVAAKELGMSEPLAHQIVYLSLPRESRTFYPEQ